MKKFILTAVSLFFSLTLVISAATDTTAPAITIVSPSLTNNTYTTKEATLPVSALAVKITDVGGIATSTVRWNNNTNNTAGNLNHTPYGWLLNAPITLNVGINTITVRVNDMTGNTGTKNFTITRTDSTSIPPVECKVASFCNRLGKTVETKCGCGIQSAPWVVQTDTSCYHKATSATCTYTASAIAIVVPTLTNNSFTTDKSTLPVLELRITDAAGAVASTVKWTNSADGSTGKFIQGNNVWTATYIPVLNGSNTITITAVYSSGNTDTATFTVMRNSGYILPSLRVITPTERGGCFLACSQNANMCDPDYNNCWKGLSVDRNGVPFPTSCYRASYPGYGSFTPPPSNFCPIPTGIGPDVTFTVTPNIISPGDPVTLTWNSPDAMRCVPVAGEVGWMHPLTPYKPKSGSEVYKTYETINYGIRCTTWNGETTKIAHVDVRFDDAILAPGDCVKTKKPLNVLDRYRRGQEADNSELVNGSPNPQPAGATARLVYTAQVNSMQTFGWLFNYTSGPDGYSEVGNSTETYVEKIDCSTLPDDAPPRLGIPVGIQGVVYNATGDPVRVPVTVALSGIGSITTLGGSTATYSGCLLSQGKCVGGSFSWGDIPLQARTLTITSAPYGYEPHSAEWSICYNDATPNCPDRAGWRKGSIIDISPSYIGFANIHIRYRDRSSGTTILPPAQCANNWNKERGGNWDGDGAGTTCGCIDFNKYGQQPFSSPRAQCYPPRPYAVKPDPTPIPITPVATSTTSTSTTSNPSALTIGDRIKIITTFSRVVRNTAGANTTASKLGYQPSGATGTIVSGPERKRVYNSPYDWFNINFDTGVDGWISAFKIGTNNQITTRIIEKISTSTIATSTKRCVGTKIDRFSASGGWYVVNRIKLTETETKIFCATVPRQASSLVFKAFDESNKDCGRVFLGVRQIGGIGWTKSGGSGSPNSTISINGINPYLGINRPEWTSAGDYEMKVVGVSTPPGCDSFQIAWKFR